MALTNVDLDRIDGNSGLLSNVNTTSINGGPIAGTRNRIINGDMRIDQRNAGASVTITATTADTYTLDRWAAFGSVASKFSVQQNAGSVTPPAGFTSYLGATSLSAYTPGANESFILYQRIEGYNAADLDFGVATAQAVTLSFWVRSSLTGTFGGSLRNENANRSYPFTYTISSANTWERKTITISGDTTGTWNKTNGRGIELFFSLGCGSTVSGTAGSWAAASYFSATGATSVVGTNGATFYLTGVQLEAGSVATPFERRSYGQELALCQRYAIQYNSLGSIYTHFGNGYAASATAAYPIMQHPVPLRATPTLVTTGPFILASAGSSGVSGFAINNGTTGTATVITVTSSGMTAGSSYSLLSNNSTACTMLFSAEL